MLKETMVLNQEDINQCHAYGKESWVITESSLSEFISLMRKHRIKPRLYVCTMQLHSMWKRIEHTAKNCSPHPRIKSFVVFMITGLSCEV